MIVQWLEKIDSTIEIMLVDIVAQGVSVFAPMVALVSLTFVVMSMYSKLILFMSGMQEESLPSVIINYGRKMLILGIAGSASYFTYYISDTLLDIMNGLAESISGESGRFNFYAKMITDFAKAALNESAKFGWSDIWPALILLIKSILFYLGIGILIFLSFALIAFNKIIFSLCLSVGPIFFGFLAFENTKVWFSSWLNTSMTYGFSYVFIVLIISVSNKISIAVIGNTTNNNVSMDIGFYNVVIVAGLFIYLALLIKKSGDVVGQFFSSGSITDRLGFNGKLKIPKKKNDSSGDSEVRKS